MRIALLLAFSCHVAVCLAQDEDFTDYRKKTESFARIYDKDIRSDLATFTIGGIDESLNKAPLKKIPVAQYGNNFIRFDSNRIQVTIRSGPFNATKHKLLYDNKKLVKIDNRPFYGNYEQIPTTNIAAITVVVGGDTIPIPPHAYADLYNPGFVYTDASGTLKSQDGVFLSRDNHRIYIYMLNKDSTGSYEVTWIIQDKQYLRRVLDFGFTQ